MLKRPTAVLIIFVGALLLIGSLSYGLSSPAAGDANTMALPKLLAGLPLVNATYGPEAVAEVTRLHRKEFPLTSGAMGTYGGNGAEATLWVAGLPSDAMAEQMVAAMRDKIAEGNSPFTPTGERRQDTRVIYELAGMGQKHFYFQSNDRAIWLAADPEIAGQALQSTLEFYP